jgi:hypothetical protein
VKWQLSGGFLSLRPGFSISRIDRQLSSITGRSDHQKITIATGNSRPRADIHGFQNSGKKKPAKAGSSYSFAESDYTVLRFIQPSNPSAEPSSKTAGGTGIAGTTAE